MANPYFQFKQFTVQQDHCAMKVTTDSCLFGAWVGERAVSRESSVVSVLDIGTGTGLLSLMLAQRDPKIILDAIEIDEEAAGQAKENITGSPWADRISVIRADVKKYAFGKKYDIIISNPPFYENELKGGNQQKNIAHHDTGLLLPELLHIIKGQLKPGGFFYLLLPYKRHDEIRKMIAEQKLVLSRLIFVRQTVNHDYFRILIEGRSNSLKETEILIDDISVKDKYDQYTPEFVSLLKDFYLQL